MSLMTYISLTLVFMMTCATYLQAQIQQADTVIVYKVVDGHELNLHVFYPENTTTDSMVAIVSFFGGGWTGGSASQFYPQSDYYASQGMVGISAEYRVRNTHGTSPFEAVTDAKSAIRWVREHADFLGVSKDKVIASGGSAGGHVAACTGIIMGYEEDGEDHRISSIPNAMVLFNPVLDTTEKGYGAKKMKGDSLLISPNHHIRKGLPPTITFHGDADKTVPIENATTFDEKMTGDGNTSRLVVFKGAGHGFFNPPSFRASNPEKYFNETMSHTITFLKEVGILESSVIGK